MKKDFIATQKYLIMSPRKIRLVAALVRKMKPTEAIDQLPFVQKRAGEPLLKVVKNAMASARNAGVADTDLIFKEIQIGEGPRLKRGMAASRGRWHAFKHRMAHIRVVLTTENKKISKSVNKEIKKTETKTEEVKAVKTVKKVAKKGTTK